MYKRLAKTIVQYSRDSLTPKSPRSKYLFFVEGAETEKLYLNEVKKRVPTDKNLDVEIFDRWKNLSGESNQLNIVKKTKEYLSICNTITNKQKRKIEETIWLLETKTFTIDDMIRKLEELNRFLGEEILSRKEILLEQLSSIKTCYNFDASLDKIYFVLDRDCGSFTETQYDEVLELCENCGYELGMTTPNFEFFLILHLNNVKDIDHNTIFTNENDFAFRKLKEILKNDYNLFYKKNKYNAKFLLDNFSNFEQNILNYSQDINELKNKVGSSLGIIIREILN